MGEAIFYEIAALLLAAAVIGLLGTALRQPVVVSFIAVGIIAATLFQPSPHTVEQIDFFAELGDDPHGGLLVALKAHRFQGRVAITARDDQEGRILAEGGVDLVLYPFDDAAASAATQIGDLDDTRVASEMAEAASH